MAATTNDNLYCNDSVSGSDYLVQDDVLSEQEIVIHDSSNEFINSNDKSRVGNLPSSPQFPLAKEKSSEEEEGIPSCFPEGNESGSVFEPDIKTEVSNGEIEAGGFAFYWPHTAENEVKNEFDLENLNSKSIQGNNSDDDAFTLEKERLNNDYNDKECCYGDDQDDQLIESIINEVKDSLLDFVTCNNDYTSAQNVTTFSPDEKVPDFEKMPDFEGEEGEVPGITTEISSQLANVLSREKKENNDQNSINIENYVTSEKGGQVTEVECDENVNEIDLENKHSVTNGLSPKSNEVLKDEDIERKELYINPFYGISDTCSKDDFIEGFCDDGNVSAPLESTVKEEEKSKAKPKINSKKEVKKSKKGKEIKQIIDDDVLNEVKNLIEKENSVTLEENEEEALPKEEKECDEGRGKTKEKKKKQKKKTKRSNSKCEGSSPATLTDENSSLQRRRILHRGTVWKDRKGKMEEGEGDGCCSPTSSNERGNGSPASCTNDRPSYIQNEERGTSLVNSDDGSLLDVCGSGSQKETKDLDKRTDNEEGEERLKTNNLSRGLTPPLMCSESNLQSDSGMTSDKGVCCDSDSITGTVPLLISKEMDKSTTNESIDINSIPTSNASNICELVNTSDEMAPNNNQSCNVMTPAETTTDYNTWETSKSYLELIEDITDEFPEIGEQTQICREAGFESVIESKDLSFNEDSGCDAVSDLKSDFNRSNKNDYSSCNGVDAFTFKTTVSIVKPLNPSVEFVSDNSSPLSTRSSSLDRDTLASAQLLICDEGNNSSEGVCVPPLFDHVNVSKLDGTSKLQMKYKKRHSLPKYKPSRRKFYNSKSFESDNLATTLPDNSKNSFDIGEDDTTKLYEDNYSEIHQSASKSTDTNNSFNTRVPVSINIDPVEEIGPRTSTPKDDDSDDADGTWHHKNIKEKIQKIIGARLQPKPDQRASVEKETEKPEAKDISPFPRSSTHSASSKSSSEAPESTAANPESTKSTTPSKDAAPVQSEKETDDTVDRPEEGRSRGSSEADPDEEDTRDEGKYQQKLSFNAKHLNLTYLTDSDEVPGPEVAKEDDFIADFLKQETAANDSNPVTSIVERWDALQKKAAERQRQSTQLRQLQRQVKALRLSMEGVVQRCGKYGHPHALDDPAQLGTKVDELKALLDENEGLRSDLSGLNVMVHRFSSEVGSSFTPLKDEMAELYRLWDETNRRVSGELSRMQSSEATWRLWEEQKTELSQALKQDSDTLKVIDAAIDNGRLTETVTASVHDVAKLLNERRKLPNGTKGKNQMNTVEIAMLNGKDAKTCLKMEDRLSDSGTSGYESCSSDDLSERERRLAYLRRLARDLEASLVPGSKAWNDISSTLAEAENELQGLQDQCRTLILRTAETLDPSSKQPSSRFSSNSKRRTWARDGKSFRSPRPERRNKSGGGGFRREWIWRVVRAALPFQAALLLLLCVACLLEPNCCDSVNTLNLSFTPQLRFVHGSPPV